MKSETIEKLKLQGEELEQSDGGWMIMEMTNAKVDDVISRC